MIAPHTYMSTPTLQGISMQDSQTINIFATYNGSYAITSDEHYGNSLNMPLDPVLSKKKKTLTVKSTNTKEHTAATLQQLPAVLWLYGR